MLDYHKNDWGMRVAIIGGGFCGILTAINLIREAAFPISIYLINAGSPLAKGIAYAPNSDSLLLNVPNGKMSAFQDAPSHFLNWLVSNRYIDGEAQNTDKEFSSREVYGRYLLDLWEHTLSKKAGNIRLSVINDYVSEMNYDDNELNITLSHSNLKADYAVLATGNNLPASPQVIGPEILLHKNYYANPWSRESIKDPQPGSDILIIGNGLTMIDTVFGLIQNGFTGVIHTISPGGFAVVPHQQPKNIKTDCNISDINLKEATLQELVVFFNSCRKKGDSKEQRYLKTVDELRPYVQQLWQNWNINDKRRFVTRLRRIWNNSRHRSPVQMYALIEQLQSQSRLICHKGAIIELKENGSGFDVYFSKGGIDKKLSVGRIINCTGPQQNIRQSGNKLLRFMEAQGLLVMDDLKLGVLANPQTGAVFHTDGTYSKAIFTIGNNLKSVLWESNAVPELRVQAKMLAQHLLSNMVGETRVMLNNVP